jgi:protein-S-isoprenylcysteine O-methyltransferase Ste14
VRALQYLLLAIACLVYGGVIVGYLRLFRRPDGTPWEMKVVGAVAGTVTCLQLVVIASRTAHWLSFAVALVAYLAAAGLYGWCVITTRRRRLSVAFSRDRPEFLVADGPYRVIRHPFYSSYLLYWAAGVIAAREPWLALTILPAGGSFLWAALREERKFAASPLSSAYQAYRARTGMFVPKLFGPR